MSNVRRREGARAIYEDENRSLEVGFERTIHFPQHYATVKFQMNYLLLLALAVASIATQAAPPSTSEADRAFAKCLRDGALMRRYGKEVEDATSLIREKCMSEFAAWMDECLANGNDKQECARRATAMSGLVIRGRK